MRAHEQDMLLVISHTLASTPELQPELILDQLSEIIAYTHGGQFVLEGSTLLTLAIRGSPGSSTLAGHGGRRGRGTPRLEQSPPFHILLQGPETLASLFNRRDITFTKVVMQMMQMLDRKAEEKPTEYEA